MSNPKLVTVKAYLETEGHTYPEPGPDGSIPASAFSALGLNIVVACTNCEMTMCLGPTKLVDEEGLVYCKACAKSYE